MGPQQKSLLVNFRVVLRSQIHHSVSGSICERHTPDIGQNNDAKDCNVRPDIGITLSAVPFLVEVHKDAFIVWLIFRICGVEGNS